MKRESVEKWVLRISGFAGLAVFVTFFAFTWATPRWVEDFGAEYLEREVIERVDAQIDRIAAPDGPIADEIARRSSLRLPEGATLAQELAAEFQVRNAQRLLDIKTRLKAQARELLPVAIARVRDPDCECRALDDLQQVRAFQLARLVADGTGLTAWIHSNYMRVAGEFKNEIRIFTGINALSFILLLAISFAKPAAARHLLLPGVLLLCATLFCAWLYVFSQNWLVTIVQGSYVGFAYAAYLAVAWLFLCDIALNCGRITTWILNRILDLLGGAASAISPC